MATATAQKWEEEDFNDDMWYCYRCDWEGKEDTLTLHGVGAGCFYSCPKCNSPQVDYIPPSKEIKRSLGEIF